MRPRRGLALAVAVSLPLLVVPLAAVPATARTVDAAGPAYELPFPCAQQWTGTTRAAHRPSRLSVDLNRPDDLGDLTVASAPGVVSRVADTGGTGYGRYLVVDHGGGHSTLYAHLRSIWTTL